MPNMEKIFVLIALTFVGIFQQADATRLPTYKDLEEFKVILLKFAGTNKTLDFGELMLMIGRRIMKYYELRKQISLNPVDEEIYFNLLQPTVQAILNDFAKLAGEDMEISVADVDEHYGSDAFVRLFGGTWKDLEVVSPSPPNPIPEPAAAENL